MKKLLIVAVLLCFSAMCFGCTTIYAQGVSAATDSSWKAVENSGVLKIGIDENFAPISYYNESDQPMGYGVDMASEVCRRLGVEAEFVSVTFGEAKDSLKEGAIDCIWSSNSCTELEADSTNQSFSYLKGSQVLLCLSESSAQTLVDLKGQRIGAKSGSIGEMALEKSTAFKSSLQSVGSYQDYSEAKKSLDGKKISAIVVDSFVAEYYQKQQPGLYTVLTKENGNTPEVLETGDYCVEFRPRDDTLAVKIEETLNKMAEDGTLSTLSKKWFSEDLSTVVSG